MNKRCLLHKDRLHDFKMWLYANDIPYRDGKGQYQVIQVLTEQYGWQVVFTRNDMKEHLSINEKLEPTVRLFIESTRKKETS